jgi:hypothetical protein
MEDSGKWIGQQSTEQVSPFLEHDPSCLLFPQSTVHYSITAHHVMSSTSSTTSKNTQANRLKYKHAMLGSHEEGHSLQCHGTIARGRTRAHSLLRSSLKTRGWGIEGCQTSICWSGSRSKVLFKSFENESRS